MPWAKVIVAGMLGLGCSGRTLSSEIAGDGSLGHDAPWFPDAPPPDAAVDVAKDVAPDVEPDTMAWRCTPHSAGTPWCQNEPISVPATPTNAEVALGVDSQARAVASWISGSAPYDIVAAGSTDDFATQTTFGPSGLFGFDPAVASDGSRTYLVYLTTNYVTSDLWATFSDNGGLSWSPRVQINDDVSFHDRPWVSVSPGGEVVVGWKEDDESAGEAWHRVAVSSDRGNSFAQRAALSDAWERSPPGSAIGFAADGAWVWALTDWSVSGNVRVVYLRSTDQGGSFSTVTLDSSPIPAGEMGFDMNTQRHLGLSYQTSIAASGGRVYVAFVRPAGVWQRELHVLASADGQAFGGARRVDDGAGISHMLPQFWIVTDEAAGAHLAWYEERDGLWGVYSSSTADGSSWSAIVPVSDETFEADDWGPLLEQDSLRWPGHFFGLSPRAGQLYAAWGDIRTGQSLIFFSRTAYPVY